MSIRGRRNAGFTLLELLLVVGILSALALSATAFVDNRDDQQRFEETRHRLQAIRRAILGDESASLAQFVPAGFVAENGLLPPDLNSLLSNQDDPATTLLNETSKPSGWKERAVLEPVFDPTPDSVTGQNNGTDEVKLGDGAAKLEKGWRAANLLILPGSDGRFGDAWGKAGAVPNFGWNWSLDASRQNLTVTSLGKDQASGGSGVAADMAETVVDVHWGASVASLKVKLIKRDSDFGAVGSAPKLRVSLLVFENTQDGGKWKRYTSTGVDCLDNGDGKKGTTSDINPCSDVAPLTFVEKGCDNATTVCNYSNSRLPLGRHLLVAVFDNNGAAHDSDDKPYVKELITDPTNANPAATQNLLPILCTASGCPEATLVLR